MTANTRILQSFFRLVDRDNSVSLASLRPATGLPRAAFDLELLQLRKAGLLCLSASDRYSTPEIDAAAIVERGELLTHVSRR